MRMLKSLTPRFDESVLLQSFTRPAGKRRAPADPSSGTESAARFLAARRLHADSGSSLRKLQKYLRIAAGVRPRRFKTT